MRISATPAYFRVDGEPSGTGAGATLGVRVVLLEAGGMCDATESIPLRPDEHERQRHPGRHGIGYLLLLCLKRTTLGIAIQSF